jgi:hypothetical protein
MPGRPPPGPLWLRRVLGDDFFTTAEGACVESDTDFEYLKQSDQLNYLTCGPKVTEAGLRHLEALTHLEELYLGGTQIGDAGVEHLSAFKQLNPEFTPYSVRSYEAQY